ncbi:hypothetical protein C8N24_3706 [Solirubrobacter pauli]|uniref:Uncharacterized protein n=1 Tax=Solirubrobacter pauli TaxID=166793 RepID=A0A660LFG6_9ACTN|nr:hypothetical protein C8N24_3706 [Solirubrobacter pauli]
MSTLAGQRRFSSPLGALVVAREFPRALSSEDGFLGSEKAFGHPQAWVDPTQLVLDRAHVGSHQLHSAFASRPPRPVKAAENA